VGVVRLNGFSGTCCRENCYQTRKGMARNWLVTVQIPRSVYGLCVRSFFNSCVVNCLRCSADMICCGCPCRYCNNSRISALPDLCWYSGAYPTYYLSGVWRRSGMPYHSTLFVALIFVGCTSRLLAHKFSS
jgi:hypothetical protein